VEEAKNGLVSAPFPDALRRYFLDENEPLPRHVDIYFWVYPSRRQVVIKNAGKISMNRSGVILGHVLKFLPLGFWVIWEKPNNYSLNVPALVPDKNMDIEQLYQAAVDLRAIPKLDFPEAPDDNEVILLRAESTSVGVAKAII